MERLRIKNFLIIEDADFEVGRFNLIIGSQASGKSIIAKLLYLFRRLVERSQKETATQLFEEIFPKYTWEKHSFDIYYQAGEYNIQLDYKNELNWTFPSNLSFQTESIFIPANRTSFLLIKDNIFTVLKNSAAIDFFIQEFGSHYEMARNWYMRLKCSDAMTGWLIEGITEAILKGVYVYENGKDWIETNGQRILLSNASSGQQESLPMLLVLSNIALGVFGGKGKQVIIEEPEAHLFPVSQKRIIELLSLLYNKHNTDFVLTTHSPYIPTAINCAILAHDIICREGEDAVKDIFNPDFAIKYEDVRAYTIENGHLKSILNDELRLISANVIDSVSDEFENIFSNLLAL